MIPDKWNLRIPGPTPLPPRVQQALIQPMIGHRSPTCRQLVQDVSLRLRPYFGTEEEVMIISGSGTSALEAAAISSLDPATEEAVVVVTGAFGDRFAQILTKYRMKTHRLDLPWGTACTPEILTHFLKQHPHISAVFLTYCETSTGILNPIQELATVVQQESDALVIIDGVSCIGAVECQMDAWGVDLMVTGSQKALMLPPGLAFIAASKRAQARMQNISTPSFYLDLSTYHKEIKQGNTPYTPAVSLLFALDAALKLMEDEGFSHIIQRHHLMKEMTRRGIEALALPLLTDDLYSSPTVTAVRGRIDASADEIRSFLQARGILIAGGQKDLKGEIFRIGHMGYCDPMDLFPVLSGIEMALSRLTTEPLYGVAVQAAEEVFTHVSSTRH
ncbi:alanine--glyoxylate aminotransferase family protein [Mechercharimyces sp. CAU 1602]|nr:alanine--glyoxylate aminotransferase family protein [Mechercharimyces sp. CAU 1602]